MKFLIERFEDVYHHASAVEGWSQTYSQITAGTLQSSLLQLSNPRFHLFREVINQRVVQHGEAPRGRICFAVPLAITGPVRMQGRSVHDSSIFILRGGEEFMFHMPQGMDLVAMTFDRDAFEQAFAATPQPDELKKLLTQPVVQIPEHCLVRARRRLVGLIEHAFAAAGTTSPAEAERRLEQALMVEVVGLLTDPACDKSQRHGSLTDSFIVDKCHELSVADAVHPLRVFDLCRRLRVSRRTVQNAFRGVAETTPLNYIRCIRLNGVRRDLMSTRASELTVGDAAARRGFFHLSHFAADYHALFEELPSQTRRAGGFSMPQPADCLPPNRLLKG